MAMNIKERRKAWITSFMRYVIGRRLHLQSITMEEFTSVNADYDQMPSAVPYKSVWRRWKDLVGVRFLIYVEYGRVGVFPNMRGRGFDDLLDADGVGGEPTPAVAELLSSTWIRRNARLAAEKDKNGVTVSRPVFTSRWGNAQASFPDVEVGRSGEVKFTITNAGAGAQCALVRVALSGPPEFTCNGQVGAVGIPVGFTYAVTLTCKPVGLGFLVANVSFFFSVEGSGAAEFEISRLARLRVWDPDFARLQPTAPFQKRARRARVPYQHRHIVPGVRRPLPPRGT